MGTNGSVTADFVLGYTCRSLVPGASAPAVVVKPFSQALQTAWGSATSLTTLVFRRHKSYPGLAELLGRFYASINDDLPSPTPASDILQTVEICETIGRALATAEQREDERCQKLLDDRTPRAVSRLAGPGICVLTGGTGILGRKTAATLCESGWRVRVPVRRPSRAAEKIPGDEYLPCDLADSIPDELFTDADSVVHAAAETAGTRADHERNTIQATGNLLDAMQRSCCKRLINISSVAVLKPSRKGSALSESSPDDLDNPARGPYVSAKAAAESAASRAAEAGALRLRTVRLGPLVDFDDYTPPGRSGRGVARLFVAMGNPGALLPVCSVSTAASVIGHVAGHFGSAPPVVNLLEVPEPTRRDLTARLLSSRPDLRVMWIPFPVLRVLSLCLKVLLKLRNPRGQSLDLYAVSSPSVMRPGWPNP